MPGVSAGVAGQLLRKAAAPDGPVLGRDLIFARVCFYDAAWCARISPEAIAAVALSAESDNRRKRL